jgi:hypothetical protein
MERGGRNEGHTERVNCVVGSAEYETHATSEACYARNHDVSRPNQVTSGSTKHALLIARLRPLYLSPSFCAMLRRLARCGLAFVDTQYRTARAEEWRYTNNASIIHFARAGAAQQLRTRSQGLSSERSNSVLNFSSFGRNLAKQIA